MSKTSPQIMRRILVVSRSFPLDFEHATYGIFQRLQMLLQAASFACESVDILFFIPDDLINQINLVHYEILFYNRWHVKVNLQVAPLSLNTESWVAHYIKPVFNIKYQEYYQPTASSMQSQAVAKALTPTTDLILAHRMHAALPVYAAGKFLKLPPVVVDIDDIEHRKFWRDLRQPPYWAGKFLLLFHLPAMALAERDIVRKSIYSLVCSDVDRQYLQRLSCCNQVTVVPNAVDLGATKADVITPHNSRRILFVGAYSYKPNVEAAEFLLNEVFPLVRAHVPDAELMFVGPRIEVMPSQKKSISGVFFLGFVDDLDEIWANARMLCCPILVGGGTRIKIIEAAARGVPVVSTTIGAEGLNFVNGQEILLHDNAAKLAEACIRLLQDDELVLKLTKAARIKVLRYDKTAVTQALARLFQTVTHSLRDELSPNLV